MSAASDFSPYGNAVVVSWSVRDVLRICSGAGNEIHGNFAFPDEWKNRFGKKEKGGKIKRKEEGKYRNVNKVTEGR